MDRDDYKTAAGLFDDKVQQAQADYGIPLLWASQVNRACTQWLKERGLLPSQAIPAIGAAQATRAAQRERRRQDAASLPSEV